MTHPQDRPPLPYNGGRHPSNLPHQEIVLSTDPQAILEADADTVANRATQVIASMGADIRALTGERDRYRSAWCSARERAQAYGEGILRVVKDRESYQEWLRQAEERLVAASAAAPEAAPPTGQAGLRDRIRRAVCEAEGFAWDSDMLEPDEYGDVADTVLAALFGPIPAGTDTATWTAIRAIQLMNEAGRERDAATAEPHRLALSTALGLGTSAPWDAIRERAAELGGQGAAGGRGAVLREAADGFDRHAEKILDGFENKAVFVAKALRDQAAVWREAAETLRRLAAETPGPETQGEAEAPREIVHACPPDGSDLTPCCDHTPFELPRTDRMSTDPALVTCPTAPAVVAEPGKENNRG